ncbi:hypothetical protein AcW2_000259 [Taiwanofungus camphoratus]|nr:hypothetical protein AcW2_000259 [Antrodia cinnamomea]
MDFYKSTIPHALAPFYDLLQWQPLVGFVRWNAGVGMDIIRLGLRCLVVGLASAVLALAGILLSVLSALGHSIPGVSDGLSQSEPTYSEDVTRVQNLHTRSSSLESRRSLAYSQRSISTSADSDATIVQHSESVHVRFVETHTVHSYLRIPRASPRDVSGRRLSPIADNSPVQSAFPLVKDENFPEMDDSTACRPSPVRRLNTITEQHKQSPQTAFIPGEFTAGNPPDRSPVSSDLGHHGFPERPDNLDLVARGRPKIAKMPSSPHAGFKEIHKEMKDRLLRKTHSLPCKKNARNVRRTDPYQAPYFFPTPGSPEAAHYVRSVRVSRTGGAIPPGITTEQRLQRKPSDLFPLQIAGPSTSPIIPSKEIVAEPEQIREGVETPPSSKSSRRRSWHSLLPRHSIPRRSSAGPEQDTEAIPAAGVPSIPPSPQTASPKKLGKSRSLLPSFPRPSARADATRGRKSEPHMSPRTPTLSLAGDASVPEAARLPRESRPEASRKQSWHARFHHRRSASVPGSSASRVDSPNSPAQ